MNYKVNEIIDQLVGVLKHASVLSNVTVNVFPGSEYDPESDVPELVQNLVQWKNFVFVQYAGKSTVADNSIKTNRSAVLKFRVLVGASNVVDLETSRENVFTYLAAVYDSLNGCWLASPFNSVGSNLVEFSNGSTMIANVTATLGQELVVEFHSDHGLVTGDKIYLRSVAVATEANNTINNPSWTVTVVDSSTVRLNSSSGLGNNATPDTGKWVYALTSTGFKALGPVQEAEGDIENIVVDYPSMLVYETFYTVKVVQ